MLGSVQYFSHIRFWLSGGRAWLRGLRHEFSDARHFLDRATVTAFLFLISMVPLTTRLLAEFPSYRIAPVIYWLNVLIMGATLGFRIAACAPGWIADLPPDFYRACFHRILLSQLLYGFGAPLCFVAVIYSIIFIVAVQVAFASAPNRLLAPRKSAK